MRAATLVIPILMLCTSAGQARAEPTVVIVAGDVTDHERDVAASAIASEADAQQAKATTANLNASERATVSKCLTGTQPWSCVRAVLPKGTQRLIVSSLKDGRAPDGGRMIEIAVQMVVPTLDAVIDDSRYCTHCTDDVLGTSAAELTRKVFQQMAIRQGRTVISVKSVPRGARITLDGTTFGATDSSINTYPGAHTVMLELDGYQTEKRTVAAIEGKTSEIVATLRRIGEDAQHPNHDEHPSDSSDHTTPADNGNNDHPHPHLIPGIVIGGGFAAMAIGVVLQVAKDGPPLGQDQPTYIISAPGVGLAVGGAVVIGVGVYLWKRASNAAQPTASPPAATTTPTISFVEHGGMVGWMGSF